MNMHIMINSKNPLMCTGMFMTPDALSTVRSSSTMNTNTAKNNSFHGIRYTLLSLTGVVKSLRNKTITTITSPRLYRGAASARLSARLILHTRVLC